MYGSGYGGGGGGGGMYGGSSYLNPYSRDPKYLMGEPGFPNAIESHFGWVNDFGRIVDTFARISWLLDMNLETMYDHFYRCRRCTYFGADSGLSTLCCGSLIAFAS